MMVHGVMERRASIAWAVVATFVLAACARNPEPRSGAESASAGGADTGALPSSLVEARGRVVNSGTDRSPMTVLVADDGSSTRLGGALLDELRALSGAELAVRGVMDSDGERSLDVREYEVLSIDGRRPEVGVLLERGGELWLASSDTLRLVPALEALRAHVGFKVWVVGTRDSAAGALRVESYGVISRSKGAR